MGSETVKLSSKMLSLGSEGDLATVKGGFDCFGLLMSEDINVQ